LLKIFILLNNLNKLARELQDIKENMESKVRKSLERPIDYLRQSRNLER